MVPFRHRRHRAHVAAWHLLYSYVAIFRRVKFLPCALKEFEAAVDPAAKPRAYLDHMASWLRGAQLGVAGGGPVDLAGWDAQVPARDLHRPAGEVTVFVLNVVEGWKQLSALPGEPLA